MKARRRLLLLKKLLLIKLMIFEEDKINAGNRRLWVRKLYEDRKSKGEFNLLIRDLKLHDDELFFRYFRMSPTNFEGLFNLVGPLITKEETKMREPISASERLCVTMRYLVTGDAQVTIATSFRMSPAIVGQIIHETCNAIWDALCEKGYLKAPNSEKEWQTIAEEFYIKWNFPHAIGAIDGKHVVMQAPARSGSSFFNYKKQFSIVLMAVCSAKYKFILVDIGDTGRQSDGSVYFNSNLGFAIEENRLNIPKATYLPGTNRLLPYVFVADDAFGLKPHMMKPYPFQNLPLDRRVFNYRLSRARRIVENAFGIAASRFRVFRRPIIAKVDKVVAITKAVVALHNLLISISCQNDNYNYCPDNFVDTESRSGVIPGDWRKDAEHMTGLQCLSNISSNNYSKNAAEVREEFKNYFMSEGAVDWQWDIVNKL